MSNPLPSGYKAGLFGKIALWVLGHRRLTAVSTLMVFVVSVILGFPPKVDSDILTMLPPDKPVIAATKKLNEEEGGVAFLLLAFNSLDDNADASVMTTFMRGLEERVKTVEGVEYAIHDVDPDLALKLGLMNLEKSDVQQLSNRLKGALALGPALNPMVLGPLLDMGPVSERLSEAQEMSFLASTATHGRLLIRPKGSPSDQKFTSKFMEDIEHLIDEAQPEANGVSLAWMGGPYRHLIEDYKGIKQDIWWTGLTSLFLVLGLITFSFRSFRAALLVGVPLILANVMTLAFAGLYMGHLNTFTSVCFAMLIGLGIDFAIHLVGRYRELRADGWTLEEALARAWDRSGPPCATAAMTSAAGFLALIVASFQGFSQLGVLLAFGLVVCLVSMVVVLPLLIPTLDPKSTVPLAAVPLPIGSSKSSYRLAPVGLGLAIIATAMIAVVQLPKLEFNYDLSSLRRSGMAWTELSEQEQQLAQESYSPVVISYPSRETLGEAHHRIDGLRKDGDIQTIGRVLSIENVLPTDQDGKLKILADLIEQLDHPNLRYVHASPARPLIEALLPLKGIELSRIKRQELPKALLHILGAGSEETHRLLLVPAGNMWDMRNAEQLLEDVTRVEPNQPIAGEIPCTGTMFRTVMDDMPIVGGLALFLVFALAAVDLKKPHWVIGAVGTLLAGMIWAGVAIDAVGVRLSLLNLMGIPILLGIGIDVIIHLLHRLAEEGPGGLRRALSTTGVAATISTLTSVASFFSLTLAGNRGIQSMGVLVVFGLTAVFIVSAILLPLAWAAGWRMTGRAPSDAP